jgi:hypothetical protein
MSEVQILSPRPKPQSIQCQFFNEYGFENLFLGALTVWTYHQGLDAKNILKKPEFFPAWNLLIRPD